MSSVTQASSLGTWESLRPIPQIRSHAPLIPYNDRLYAFGGGAEDFRSLDSTYYYDFQQDQWLACRPMPSKRSGTVAARVGNSIYVMGGGFKQESGQFKFLNTLEIYFPEEDRWEKGPDLLQPHDYPAVAKLGDYVYVMGGHHPEAYKEGPKTDPGFDFCERFDVQQQVWQNIASLPTPRFALVGVSYHDKILSLGGVAFTPQGFNNFDFVETFDPVKEQWQVEDQYCLPWTAAGLGATVMQDKIYIFGGYSGDGIHNRAAVFHGDTGWQLIAEMPQPGAAMGVASLHEQIYLLGGWTDDGRTPTDKLMRYSL